MKKICWALVAASSLAFGDSGASKSWSVDEGFRDLVVAPAVSDNLALLFSQFDTELVLCLEGELRGADLHITDFRMPHILASEHGRVQAAGCKRTGKVVGTWHNHPANSRLLISPDAAESSRNCYLSRTDIADFLRRKDALISVVSCAPSVLAYWRRQDVESLTTEVAMLTAPDRQIVRYDSWSDLDTSGLTQARRR
ncbi:MAG: hypothetical protein JSU87_05825 [Gemmatimonadota bacterium]|nr:MAG: hypothetical protein JSU87_05825 [Gemmatimonadota bacterium]